MTRADSTPAEATAAVGADWPTFDSLPVQPSRDGRTPVVIGVDLAKGQDKAIYRTVDGRIWIGPGDI